MMLGECRPRHGADQGRNLDVDQVQPEPQCDNFCPNIGGQTRPMTRANTRRTAWLSVIAFGFALALLAPSDAASAGTGASPGGGTAVAPLGTAEHHAECPLVAERVQPALAQAPKALESGSCGDCLRDTWSDFALALPARAGTTPAPPPASSRPLYLLSSRLRR